VWWDVAVKGGACPYASMMEDLRRCAGFTVKGRWADVVKRVSLWAVWVVKYGNGGESWALELWTL
jgi:hypothetical protein